MSKPAIRIENARAVNGAVDLDATVAGYLVKLRMPDDFVEVQIGGTDDDRVRRYFQLHAEDIQDAAWKRAYDHSTRDMKAGDGPGPVPYLGRVQAPFDKIQVREG